MNPVSRLHETQGTPKSLLNPGRFTQPEEAGVRPSNEWRVKQAPHPPATNVKCLCGTIRGRR